MTDYISRDALSELVGEPIEVFLGRLDLKLPPTVKAEPVRQGKWIGCTNEESVDYECKCSVCGLTVFDDFARNYKYCPNCGARLDENTFNK